MRPAFLLLALALGAALGWFFLTTEPSALLPLDSIIHAQEALPTASNGTTVDLTAPAAEAASVDERTLERDVAKIATAPPEIRWNELELLGQLVSHGGQPLTGYTILVAPTGLKPSRAGVIPPAQRCITDEEGHCAFVGLSEPGPWDVYAFPMGLAVRDSLERNARVGTVTAMNPGDAERVTFSLPTGAVAILRSPLPEGVQATDIWVEAMPAVSLEEAIRNLDPRGLPPKGRTVHRFAQFRSPSDTSLGDVDSPIIAMLPARSKPERIEGYGVYVRTLDGLFGLVSIREEVLGHAQEIVIDDALEPRGRVAVRLTVQDVRSEPMGDADWQLAIGAVDWRLLMDDPGRSSPNLPRSFQTTSRNHSWVRTGPSTFELADLPVGVPLEIGAIGADSTSEEGPGTFVATSLVRATPIHGEAEPIEVRIRRVR